VSVTSTPPDHVKLYLRRDWIWAAFMALCSAGIGLAIWAHNEIVRLEVMIGTHEARIKFLEDRRAHSEAKSDEQQHDIDWIKGRLSGTR
jgi:hypothetical protein